MKSYYFKQAQFTLIVFFSIISAQLKLNAQGCTPPNIISTTPGSRCGIGTTTLGVSGDPGATFKWYAAASGGTPVGTGSVFTTPTLNSTTNFYVTASTPGATATQQTLGAGASADAGTPHNFTDGFYGGLKAQYLFRASELTAAGVAAGNITSLKFDLTSAGSVLNGFTVQMGTTALTEFTSADIQGGLSTVFPSASFTPVVGANTLNFSTPFNWDGSSNIIISLSWSNNNYGNNSSSIAYDATSYNACQMYRVDVTTAAAVLAFTGSAPGGGLLEAGSTRPAFTLTTILDCESPRTLVSAVVSAAPALALTTSAQVCANVIKPLTVTSNVSDYNSYIWSPATNLYTNMSATTPYTGGSATTLYYKATANSNLVYTVTATNSANGCRNLATTAMTTNLVAINASASPTVVCSGSPVNLNATTNVITTGTVAIGNGTSTTDGGAFEPTPFANDNGNYRIQTIYTAAELFAAGLRAGNITSIAYRITTIGASATNANYTVKCGTTTATTFNDFVPSTGFTTVFPPSTYTHAVGLNTINFTTPYLWDGVSNIIVDVSHDGIAGGSSAEAYYTQTPGNTVVFTMNGNTTSDGNPDNMRLNIIFTGQMAGQGAGALAWQWNPGAINSNTATVNPANTGTNPATSSYTITATDPVSTCSNTAVVSVLVHPMPALPLAFNSSQCGLGIPTASVSGASTYKWYAAPTSTAVLQSGTSTNFTTAINATTTWYVSSYNTNCENTRTAVTTTVIPANTINAVSSSTATCPGQPFSLTASQTGTATPYQFTWTATPAAGSGIATSLTGATVSVTPTISGTYAYMVTGVAGACTATAAVNVTAKALPVINASASPSVTCSGAAVTLNASNGIQWNPGAINSNTAVVTPTTGATPSTVVYTVTAMNPVTTCSNTASVSITVNPSVTVSVTASTPTLCSGTPAVLTASGATTYSWMPAGGTAATITVSPVSTTVYTLTGSSLSCNSTKTISIGVTPGVTLAASSSASVICAGATVSLTATGASNYTWTPSGTMAASVSVMPTATTTYSVRGESAGCSQTKTLTVTVNNAPTLTVTASPSVALCSAGASATLTATGTSTAYAWSNGSTMALSLVAPSTTTTYTVTGQNSCGTSTAIATVTVATTPTISASSSSSLICVNNAVVLTTNATPGVSYAWNTGATTSTTSVSPGITTTYTVTGTNACGTATAVIAQQVSPCTGIEEMNDNSEISLYPNPAKEYINIAIPSDMTSFVTTIEVTDALGKLVMKELLTADHTTLNLNQLEEGIYFFTVTSHDRIVKISKVVK